VTRVVVGAIKITRPLNCLSALGSVILGGYVSAGFDVPRLWVAGVVAATLTATANVVNDYFDVETDCINKPFRALPSSQLSTTAAVRWAVVLATIGLGLSLFLGIVMTLIAVLMVVLLYAYSWKLKRHFLVGNALVSLMSAMTCIYGGIAVKKVGPAIIPALLILLFIFCREILKTVEDYEGDYQIGARTVAVVLGKTGALRAFAALAVLVVLISLLPWLLGTVSTLYPVLVVPGVDGVLLLAAAVLLKWPTQRFVRMALAATKADWVLWVAAMFISVKPTI
jgi:geranylgeranylglycerol-phosphate geranylgeranyltransferase